MKRPLSHRELQNFPPYKAFTTGKSGPAPWLEAAGRTARELHLYFSIPFCTYKGLDEAYPEKCGFCLFPTLPFSRRDLNGYLDAMITREMPMYAEYVGKHTSEHPVDSIFLGGGTPNILNPDQYERLLQAIRDHFWVREGTEITTEGAPELYSFEKLARFKRLGGTRVSIGVQQFNKELLKLSGRKVSKQHVKEIITCAMALGLSVSVDLIYGWPDQTLNRFLKELEELADTGVPRFTVYPLNISHASFFSKKLFSRLPPKRLTKEMFFRSRELLISKGFIPVTLNDYEKKTADPGVTLRHEVAMRNEHKVYRMGFGFAAGSKLLFVEKGRGIAYRNTFNRNSGLSQYLLSLKNNIFPLEAYFDYSPKDLLLNYISGALQSFAIDLKDLSRCFPEVDVQQQFGDIIETLESMDWMHIHGETAKLTLEGQFYTDIVQGVFFYDRIQSLKGGSRRHLGRFSPEDPTQQKGMAAH